MLGGVGRVDGGRDGSGDGGCVGKPWAAAWAGSLGGSLARVSASASVRVWGTVLALVGECGPWAWYGHWDG